MKLQLSIIILSYNTKDLINNCLESIKDNLKDINYEVIVVDNASSDGTQAFLKKNYKDIVLIENKVNEGFAKGVNIGTKKAKGDYLFFLNSDALLKQGIKEAISLFESYPKIGIIGGMFVDHDGSYQKSHGSSSLVSIASLIFFGTGESSTKHKEQDTDWVSGGCLLIRKELFQLLGGFDEHLFMYIEDMELCYRVKKEHYRVVFFPKIIAEHKGHGSSNREFAIIHIYEGLVYFLKKHKNRVEYSIGWLVLVIKAILAIIIGVITGNRYLLRTYGKAIRVIL